MRYEPSEKVQTPVMVCTRIGTDAIKAQQRMGRDLNDFLTKAVENHPFTIIATQMGLGYMKMMTSAMSPK